jgi:Leucine-rich repeat (LRR) protein
MFRVHPFLLFLFLKITAIKSYNISSCIPNTPCQCYLTQYSFNLLNCSHTLPDLPIFNSKNTNNITKIIARNAFNQWPVQLCKYSNIQILDLSGSYFDSQFVDFSCLNHLIHLNLSNTHLKKIPNFRENLSDHLQILDLSNNNIKIIDGIHFQSLKNLISLFLQNNPIELIEHIEYLFNSTNLESINFLSSNIGVTLKQSLTINQWIDIAKRWSNSTKLFLIRMNNIPFQSIIPYPDQFERISTRLMKIIFKKLINSTFMTLFNTPKCDCIDLRNYQRMFSFVEYPKKYSSPLFQSVKCLMSDGITHARLFDRRTTVDLRCSLLGKKLSFFPTLSSSSSMLNYTFISLILSCLFLMC